MKKLLLVIIVGMVLVLDVYGLVKDYKINQVNEVDHIEETTIKVYVE